MPGARGLGGDGDCANSHCTAQGVPLKSARERMNIISTYREVGTYRGAAELCGTTHKTVKRAVERAEAGGPPAREPRPRNFDAVRDLVAERVAKSRGRISAKRLLPIARAAGYEGSPRNFRRLVAEQKALWRKDNHRGRRPAVWSPGEYLVIDWAEAAPGLFLFCAVLAFSRWRFVAVRHRSESLHHDGDDRRGADGDRRGADQGAGRSDGVFEGRGGRQRGRPHR